MKKPVLEKPVVIVDTREQTPLEFNIGLVTTERGTLTVGDYALKGDEGGLVIERKSLPDLLNCLGNDRQRFMREMRELRRCDNPILLVESTWAEIKAGNYEYSTIHKNSVMGSLYSLVRNYRISIWWSQNHADAGDDVEWLMWQEANKTAEKCRKIFGGFPLLGGTNANDERGE